MPADRDRSRRARRVPRPRRRSRSSSTRSTSRGAASVTRRGRTRWSSRSPARGRPEVGFDAVVASTIPIGSGLSSSAAFEVAIALAAAPRRRTSRSTTRDRSRSRAGGRAPRDGRAVWRHGPDGVGVRARGSRAAARLPHLDRVDPVALPDVGRDHRRPQRPAAPPRSQRVRRPARRVRSGRGAPRCSDALRDATPAQVADDPIARHVVSENARVLQFVDALRAGDIGSLWPVDGGEPCIAA